MPESHSDLICIHNQRNKNHNKGYYRNYYRSGKLSLQITDLPLSRIFDSPLVFLFQLVKVEYLCNILL